MGKITFLQTDDPIHLPMTQDHTPGNAQVTMTRSNYITLNIIQ